MKVQETMAIYGASVLSVADLLEIILSTGDKAHKLLDGVKEPFRLLDTGEQSLIHKGLTKTQAQKVSALLELVKRYNQSAKLCNVTSPELVYQHLANTFRWTTTESFVVLVLNSKNHVIAEKIVSQGTLTGAVVHPREVYKVAIENSGAAIIVAHNHPSGDPYPSREDNEITKLLVEAGKTLGIPCLDHIIIGNNQYYSYQESGKL